MKTIYRYYKDTEVSVLATKIECPYCGEEWMEDDMDVPGATYTLTCDDEINDGCGKEFEMHFDVS